ncbi:hypothetical protein [Streptomyces sp. NPDC055287]
MTHILSRRIAPILILGQIAYITLLEIAFTLVPDTAELDRVWSIRSNAADKSASSTHLRWLAGLLTTCKMAAGPRRVPDEARYPRASAS